MFTHSLEYYKKQAGKLKKQFVKKDELAVDRVLSNHPYLEKEKFALADAQLVIAREQGFATWGKLQSLAHRLERGCALCQS